MLSPVKNLRAANVNMVEAARKAEAAGDHQKAIRLYEEMIASGNPDPFPFTRLMILYRKEKRYKDELRVIDSGIEALTKDIEEKREKKLADHGNMNKLKQLSAAFLKSAGYKKDSGVLLPAPVPSWINRKKLVEEKAKALRKK